MGRTVHVYDWTENFNSPRTNTEEMFAMSPFHFPHLTFSHPSRTAVKMSMKAVIVKSSGKLSFESVQCPLPIGAGDVLIKVAATALNRGEVVTNGMNRVDCEYCPGLECSGTIIAVGSLVRNWNVGDQVCSLLNGGGYAEKVVVPAGQVLPLPQGISLEDAASLPEAACTVWSTIFMSSRLSRGETFLLHGGCSGIGTFAIQLAKYFGARVFTTAGTEEKIAFCKNLGADVCINYKTDDFVARVEEETEGKGVDVILDYIGGSYFQRNLESIGMDGRVFIIGCMEGKIAETNISVLLDKRVTIQAARLRHRSAEKKVKIIHEVKKYIWPAIQSGAIKPVIYASLPLSKAAEAHSLMDSGANIGKILLIP